MQTSTLIPDEHAGLHNSPEPTESPESAATLDRTLAEIRSGRRLEKLIASIQGFLNGQIARLDKALDECQAVADNDRIMRTVLASFETEKKVWQQKCDAESKRLEAAGRRLADGWKQLEDERRKLLDERRAV